MPTYDIGDIARLTVTFTDPLGTPTSPTTVTLTVQAPDNTQSIITSLLSDSPGVHYYNLSLTQSGTYLYRFAGTGSITQSEEGAVTVRPTTLVPQPVPAPTPVTSWTTSDLAALMTAIKSGSKRVRFQDREVEYHSLTEMMRLRDLMLIELGETVAVVSRQIRMQTSRGF